MPAPVLFFLKYFLFIGVGVCLVNTAIVRRRISAMLQQQPELREQAARFLRGYLLAFTIPPLILAALQIAGGFDDCFYPFSRDYENIYVVLSWCVAFVCSALLLYWVLFRNGARTIITFRAVLGNVPDSETAVKVLTVLCTCAGLAGLLFGIVEDAHTKIFRMDIPEPAAADQAPVEVFRVPSVPPSPALLVTMRIVDVTMSVLLVVAFVAFACFAVNFLRYAISMKRDRRRKFPVKNLVFCVIPAISIAPLSGWLNKVSRQEIVSFIGDSSRGELIVTVRGEPVAQPDVYAEELATLRPFAPDASYPDEERIEVKIIRDGKSVTLELGRDPARDGEYWVFYPKYLWTADNGLGSVRSTVFDEY